MDGFVTESAVAETRALLDSPDRIAAWTTLNYELGLRYFSHRAARDGLSAELAMVPSLQ